MHLFCAFAPYFRFRSIQVVAKNKNMKIVIIGNGIAGITAARYIRKQSKHEIVVISEETDYFFSRTALMYVYMGHLKFEHTEPYEAFFWEKNRISLLKQSVNQIDTDEKKIIFLDGETLNYDKLILATGSQPNRFGWEGQDLKGVQGLYFKQDLDSMMEDTPLIKHAVIVGGGLIGIEMAEMFHSRHIPVTFLVREKSFWDGVLPKEESAMINRHILQQKGINLCLETELKSILGDENERVSAIITNKNEKIDCQFVGLTVGVSPSINLAKHTNIETNRGFLVDEYLETSVKDVYAIGDCAELRQAAPHRKAVEAVWYTGKLMGPIVANTICGNPSKYVQGIWFNSAKFFDIEYQVYGQISPILPENEKSLYWEHADGKKSIRIQYQGQTGAVKGFNLMGVRYRQEVCEAWIASATHIENVLANLSAANFDPEFFEEYEAELLQLYASQTGKKIVAKSKRGLDAVKTILQIFTSGKNTI